MQIRDVFLDYVSPRRNISDHDFYVAELPKSHIKYLFASLYVLFLIRWSLNQILVNRELYKKNITWRPHFTGRRWGEHPDASMIKIDMMVHQNKVKLQPWWRRLNYGASEGKNVCVNSFKMSLNKRGTRSNDLQKEWQMAAGAGRAVLNRPPEASIPPKCFPKWRQSRRRLVSITRVCHLRHKFSFRKKKSDQLWSNSWTVFFYK